MISSASEKNAAELQSNGNSIKLTHLEKIYPYMMEFGRLLKSTAELRQMGRQQCNKK